jgi:flavorubredoxin
MTELKNNIFYIGTGKSNSNMGSNAYLIKGKKIAVIDGVAAEFENEYISNIEEITPISKIDYIIFNNTAAEHSGSFEKILELNPQIEVIGTIAAIKNLKEITNREFNEHIAKDGAELDLGNGQILKFMITPNLPWPDTMMTYIENEKILFSCNAFSSNLKFDENYNEAALQIYFDEVISPFKPFALKTASKLSNMKINTIYTGFGPILTGSVIDKYIEWSTPIAKENKTVVIVYTSQSGNTAHMAEIIEKTMRECGVEVDVVNLSDFEGSIKDKINSADAIAFGTPTVNRNAMQSIWASIAKLDLVNMKNTPCFVFGSYGWGGEGLHFVHNHLKLIRLRPFEKPFGCLFKMSADDEAELIKYTKRFLETM